jgi:hypothetical protein
MKKKEILDEIIDDENNLIGNDDIPENGSEHEMRTSAGEKSATTDTIQSQSHQNFKNDFLGRFGFYFYEGKNQSKELVEKIMTKKDLELIANRSEEKSLRKEKIENIADLLNRMSDQDVELLVKVLIEKRDE